MGSNKDVVAMREMVGQLADAVAKDDKIFETLLNRIDALTMQIELIKSVLGTPAAILRPQIYYKSGMWHAILIYEGSADVLRGKGNNPIAALAAFNDKYREQCKKGWKTDG